MSDFIRFLTIAIGIFLGFIMSTYAVDPVSSVILQKDLGEIINNQNTTNQSLATANNALSPGVLTQDLSDSVEGWSNQSDASPFINYVSQSTSTENDGQNQADGPSNYATLLPNNSYYMSLIQGNNYTNESDDNIIPVGMSTQSAILATAALSQMNANNKANQSITNAVQDQLSADWLNGLKSSTRDQLLRSISLQLSVNNLINYQQLQQERIGSLLKVAELLDNHSLKQQLGKFNDIEKMLNNMNINLMYINKSIIKTNG
ncbi:hypothetical protein [Piscirickettsia litoralis]|uniref:Uncharacterized protein n=1 Tax=Piscirickettsia litoralis TaxID=1891921 RepID=A0ABX3A0T5_9GAMM|nr:hypothetical protein [Piscirickettsia litoralis]ODN42481.1 hypothetical protein BGC07_05490 [Piscirickettsia litoralis]